MIVIIIITIEGVLKLQTFGNLDHRSKERILQV